MRLLVYALISTGVFLVQSPAHAAGRSHAAAPAVAIQVALDAHNFSPGAIDGTLNANTKKALKAFQRAQGMRETGIPTADVLRELQVPPAEDALTTYRITEKDAAGPFLSELPQKLEDQALLDHLSYRNIAEMLAERFHMDERYLKHLNPRTKFTPGDEIKVANIRREDLPKITRIDVDKAQGAVIAYSGDRIAAQFPATIGSEEKPSPSGHLTVTGVARNPTYTYDPSKLDFKGVRAAEKFTIKPGPNNPVGLVWIALSEDGYGIHGAPQPSAIGKTRSHGCVRLTNWDALELAQRAVKGLPVEFIDCSNCKTVRR